MQLQWYTIDISARAAAQQNKLGLKQSIAPSGAESEDTMKYFGKVSTTGADESENTTLYIMDSNLAADTVVVCTAETAKSMSMGGAAYIGKLTINHPWANFGTYEDMMSSFIDKAYKHLTTNGYIEQDARGLYTLTSKDAPEA
jgi:hypothetical protein